MGQTDGRTDERTVGRPIRYGQCNQASSSHFDTFRMLGSFLAQNQTNQRTPDGIKVSGVYERVGAEVEMTNEQYGVVALFVSRERGIDVQKEIVDV